jgi:hypothetical protein
LTDFSSPSNKNGASSLSIVLNSLASIERDLANLNAQVKSQSKSECERFCSAILKAQKLLSLAIANSSQEYHYASFKLLRSASKALTECAADVSIEQQGTLDKATVKSLVDLMNRINYNVEQISRLYLLDSNNDAGARRAETTNTSKAKKEKFADTTTSDAVELNILNGWILSEFNLVSNDFNNELALISGDLFDLNYNYELHKILSKSCLLMKLRHPSSKSNDETSHSNSQSNRFVLKVIF